MSINSLEPDMAVASDVTLAKMFKKINELVADANSSLLSDLKLRNEIAGIKKELRDLKAMVANRG